MQQMLQGPDSLIQPQLTVIRLQSAAASIATGALHLADSLQANDQAFLDICRIITPAFGSERLLAAHAPATQRLLAKGPRATAEQFGFAQGSMHSRQFRSLHTGLTMASRRGVLRAFAQQTVSPRVLIPWLQAQVGALQSIPLRESKLTPSCARAKHC